MTNQTDTARLMEERLEKLEQEQSLVRTALENILDRLEMLENHRGGERN